MPSDRLQTALWIGVGFALLGLIYLLGPILAPFLLAAILAYIGRPLVDRLEDRGLPPIAAILAFMGALATAALLLIVTLVPLIREETGQLLTRLPQLIDLINDSGIPWLQQHLGIRLRMRFSADEIRQFIGHNWDGIQAVAGSLLESAATGGQALFQILSTLLLTPVALFYLLRDWNGLLARCIAIVPRPWEAQTLALARDVDTVLGEFLRGQLSVMAALAGYYSLALALAGVDFALPLGLLTGLLIFIPYLGYASGFVLALIVALLQFQGWGPVVGVLGVFGLGQILESFVLTPRLVGERIGLHPLAVIFALLAFGQLFGFFGILAALPASAALLVGLRRLRQVYFASRFYRGDGCP